MSCAWLTASWGEARVDRLVRVPHSYFELFELRGPLLEEWHRERPQRDVPHDERDAKHGSRVGHIAKVTDRR